MVKADHHKQTLRYRHSAIRSLSIDPFFKEAPKRETVVIATYTPVVNGLLKFLWKLDGELIHGEHIFSVPLDF